MIGLGGNAQLGIGISVMLEDRFSANARKVASSMRDLRKLNDRDTEGALRDYQQRARQTAIMAGAASVGLFQAVKAGAKFEQQLQKVAIVAEGKIGRGKLKSLAMDLAETFRIDPTQATDALFENVKSGVTTGIDLITKYQVAVAKATGETLEGEEGVAKGLLSITNSMQIPYKEFARVANAVTVAANQSQASVQSLNEAMQYSANTSYQAGYNLETTLAALAQLSQMGIEGSRAGTALSNMIRYMAKGAGGFETGRQRKALALMGLDSKDLVDANGNLKDMLDLLDLMNVRLRGMGNAQQLGILEAMFGVRGEKSAINLMGADGRGFSARNMLNSINTGTSQDIAMKQAKAMMDTLQGDLDLVKVKWAQLLIQFTESVEPLLRKLMPVISKGLSLLASFVGSPIGTVLANFLIIVTPLVAVMAAFRAAAISATFALGSMSSTMNFGTAMRAGLGLAGARGMAARGVGRNAAGAPYVLAGRTVDIGGKIYRGGQILPRAMGSIGGSMMMGSMFAGAGKGLLGRLAGGVASRGLLAGATRVLGFLGGPWGMGIAAALTFVPMIYDYFTKKKPDEEDRTLKGYLPEFSAYSSIPGYDKSRVDFLNQMGMADVANKELHNNINVYLNGEQVGQQTSINQLANEMEIFNQFSSSF